MELNGIEFDLRKDADIVLKKSLPFALSTIASPLVIGAQSRWGGVTVPMQRFRWAPFYEFALIRGVKKVVRPGDTVVVVGGGFGVSSVTAARNAGPTGRVIIYEGNPKRVAICRRTVAANDVDDRCEVIHAVVATPDTVEGTVTDVGVLPPNDIPDCDVLELDCEGAEKQILTELKQKPRALVVEYHEFRGVSENDIRVLMENREYTVLGKEAEHRTTGTYILTATR
ncbi:MAG TPA: FkbM family methyltransferase [Halococcus sp.]|nr:FkbM family methyltransferase [Halococcus sp.]